MTGTFTVEALGATHDRASFSCGVLVLDRYLSELATQDVRRRVSNCFVARSTPLERSPATTPSPRPVFPPEQAKRLPRYPSFPECLIGRLAIDQGFRGRGLGSSLIVDAIARAMRGAGNLRAHR